MGDVHQLSPKPFFLLSFFFLPIVITCTSTTASHTINSNSHNRKEALEVDLAEGIGTKSCYSSCYRSSSQYQRQPYSGCGCGPSQPAAHPPPAPTPKPQGPQPSDFPNLRLYSAYVVIQQFKTTITCDPQNVTSTWSGVSICQKPNYQGIYCDNLPDNTSELTVASVDFNEFGLCAPTVTGLLDKLPDLAIFHINSNNFTGTVPDVSKLKYLYELDFSNNRFTGPFPNDVLGLSQLLFLDLRYNFFAGSVPASIFTETLAVLFLNNNLFNQPLPSNLGTTTAKYLTLANNVFTGSIPHTIGNASATLVEVLFLNNHLSGCLPYEIGFLNKATVFDAGDNFITGPIPYSFGCLAKIEQLNLANNLLYGEVPELVCQLSSLENFSLSGNYFTGLGPTCRHLLKRGILDLKQNCIPNIPMQRPHEECWAFQQSASHCPLPSTYHYVPCNCRTGYAGAGAGHGRSLGGAFGPGLFGDRRGGSKAGPLARTYYAINNRNRSP